MSHLAENLLVFGRLLRALGLDVHMGRMLDVLRALQQVDIAVRDEVFHTCRALLVHRREDLATFDRAFEIFWSRRDAVQQPVRLDDHREAGPAVGPAGAVEMLGDAAAGAGEGGALRTYSAAAALASKDFAEFTADELAVARAALDRLVWNPGERRTRRWVRGAGPRIDLRRALAGSLRTGGDVIRLPRRKRRVRRRLSGREVYPSIHPCVSNSPSMILNRR